MPKERQAVWDKTMPQLEKAVNAEYMGPILEDFLKQEYPDRHLQFRRFRVGRVFHRPGKDCRILYRMLCKNGEEHFETLLLNGIVTTKQNGHKKARNEIRESWPGCGKWKPVSFMPDLDLKLYTFPYDPKLPYLGQLLEPETVRKYVEENLDGFGLSKEWRCLKVIPQIRKYRPYKRCLLRYSAIFENGGGERQNIFFFGKTYNTSQSRYVYEALSQISKSPACENGDLNIPFPIAHIDKANTIWQLEWKGIDFGRAIEKDYGWERFPESGYLPKIAAMLAALHRVEIGGTLLEPGPTAEEIVKNTHIHAMEIVRFIPDKEEGLKQITTRFAELAPNGETQIPKATIHGTFKIAQILCRDEQLALVDFDSIACGDPLYDLAEFAASLLFLSVSDGISETSVSSSLELFLAEYEDRVPWTCDRQRLAWYMVAFLLGKIHATLKRAEAKGVKIAIDGLGLMQKWLAVAGK